VFKGERERTRLDVHLGSYHEYRLESDSLLSDVVLGICPDLCALADTADSLGILWSKTIFIAIDDNCIRADSKLDVRLRTNRPCPGIIVVVRILDQFEKKPSITSVKILG